MPNKHKTPLVGWHPPADLLAWLLAEVNRRGVGRSVILNEALREHRERHERDKSAARNGSHKPAH